MAVATAVNFELACPVLALLVRILIMKLSTYVLIALVAVFQEPTEYPPGYYCSPQGTISDNKVIDPAHPCICKRMDHSEDCDGLPIEDAMCMQWCHKDHCGCPVTCQPTKQDAHPETY